MAPRERQFNFRLSDEEYARLETLMDHYGLDASNVVRTLIKRDFDRIKKEGRLGKV